MGLKAQIYISVVSMIDVVLVEDIIETFIEVFKVEENNSSPCLHANLNLVNVSANLHSLLDHYHEERIQKNYGMANWLLL